MTTTTHDPAPAEAPSDAAIERPAATRSSPVPMWLPAVATALALLSVAGTFAPDSAGATAYVSALCTAALVALVVSLQHSRQGRGWRFVGAGITVWALAGCLGTLRLEAEMTSIPPLVISLCSTLGYIPLLIGVADLCDPQRRIRRLTSAVDGVLLLLALYAVLWLVAVEPVAVDSSLPKVDRAFSALYPAGDLALLLLAVRILSSQSARRQVGAFLTAGFAAVAVAHTALMVLSLRNPDTHYPLTDLSYLLGLSMVALAAMCSLLPAPPVTESTASARRLTVLVAVSSLAPPLVLGAIVLFTDRVVSVGPIAAWMLLAVAAAVLRHVSSVREVERTHQQSLWLATHDPTTELLYRNAFVHEVSDGSLRDRSGSVLVIEAIGLQQLRDSRGYDAVDHVMAAIATRVRTAVGEGAVIARLSHDQIGAFMRSAELAHGRQVADGLQRTLATGVAWGDSSLPLAAVIGLAQADGAVIDALGGLRRATEAARSGRPHGAGYVAIDADLTGWNAATQQAGHPARRDVIAP